MGLACSFVLLLVSVAMARAVHPALLTRGNSSAANGGRLLWSRCPQGDCGLYSRVDGVTSKLPIAPFGLPDDASEATLGVGPRGEQVAAYSRCAPSLHNCGLYVFNFATSVEQRLAVSEHSGAFMTPTVSGDRIAYAFNPRGRDASSRTYGIYWSYLNETKMRRVHTEPMDAWREQPTLSLSGTRLAYEGDSRLTSCLDQSHVRIATLGTNRDRLVATGTTRTDVFSPQWDGNVLYYGRDMFTVASYRHDFTRGQILRSRIERYLPSSGATSGTPYMSIAISNVAPAGAKMFLQLVTKNAAENGLYAWPGMPRFHRIAAHRQLTPR